MVLAVTGLHFPIRLVSQLVGLLVPRKRSIESLESYSSYSMHELSLSTSLLLNTLILIARIYILNVSMWSIFQETQSLVKYLFICFLIFQASE